MGGEAGDGVDLIEDDFPGRGEKQIHPGKAGTVEGAVQKYGGILDSLGGGFIDPGRHMDFGCLQRVFFLVIEKSGGELDLVHLPQKQPGGSHNGTAHLKTLHRFLHNHLAVIAESQRDGVGQLAGAGDFGDTEGGTGVHRFYEQGISQILRALCQIRGSAHRIQQHTAGHLHPGLGGQQVGGGLVHAEGRGEQAAADAGNPRQGQQSLHGAVLPVFSVEHGKHRVQRHLPDTFFGKFQKAAAASVR